MFTKRRFLATLGLTIPIPAIAQIQLPEIEVKPKRWFVQAWTVGTPPFIMDETASPGRLEVSLKGDFVACAQAFAIKNWDYHELAPLSIGFIVITEDPKLLKFELFGELKRLVKLETKFTEAF